VTQPIRISRKQARALGKDRYYTGSCKHGHIAERRTGSGRCVECDRLCYRRRRASERALLERIKALWVPDIVLAKAQAAKIELRCAALLAELRPEKPLHNLAGRVAV
jgi:hypothetical protein